MFQAEIKSILIKILICILGLYCDVTDVDVATLDKSMTLLGRFIDM